MKLNIIGADNEMLLGVEQLAGLLGITVDCQGIPVGIEKSEQAGLSVYAHETGYKITYNRTVEFYRALGLLVECLKANKPVAIRQTPHFDMNGAMLDNSRNAVNTVPAIKRMIRYMALMGLSSLQLYTEDTFELKEYPYFGYFRGRFTAEEIKEIDNYATLFGIELIPCIQTLAHLNQALRWKAFHDVTDCNDILLVGEDKTYQLLETMIATAASMFRSRNINIGMDEAHMLGLGNYLKKNGYQNRFDIMNRHLKRVLEICRKYGFKAMMWSDMFYHLAFGSYYNQGNIPQEVLDVMPEDVSMIYWDYYNEKVEIYEKMLDSHLKFNNPIIFAGGAWKWTGFAPAVAFSLHTSRMALESCLKKGIKKVFVTAWGDYGGECSVYSMLPTLQLYAEADFGGDLSDAALAERFTTCTGGNFEDFLSLDLPNLLPDNPAPGKCSVNPSRYLLFQDVLMGLFDKHIEEGKYSDHYAESAKKLAQCAKRNPQFETMFLMLSKLCEVLEIKYDIGVRIQKAYKNADRSMLEKLESHDLTQLLQLVSELHLAFRHQWMGENKVFGFDVQDLRFGGLIARIKAAKERIREFLDGRTDVLEELEQERLYFDAREELGEMPHLALNRWPLMVTASIL